MRRWIIGMVVGAAMVLAADGAMASVDTITHGGTTINMDFVTVGNAGNTPDDTTYGAVAYNYRIGTYEVTDSDWDAVRAADGNVGNAGLNWTGSQPTAGTSWHEAAKFCNWLTTGHYDQGYYTISGGLATIPSGVSHAAYAAAHGTTYFIPTENEWYKAAYHKNNGVTGGAANYWNYPTGSNLAPVGIRDPQIPPFDAVFGDKSNQAHPNNVTNAGDLSPYGTMGQGGNICEWNEDAWYASRVLRGGAWSDDLFRLAASNRDGYAPNFEDWIIGFRVASIADNTIPEPSTLIIWSLLGGLGIAVGWWRRRRAA